MWSSLAVWSLQRRSDVADTPPMTRAKASASLFASALVLAFAYGALLQSSACNAYLGGLSPAGFWGVFLGVPGMVAAGSLAALWHRRKAAIIAGVASAIGTLIVMYAVGVIVWAVRCSN